MAFGFHVRFTLTGAPPLVRNYGIAASEDWDEFDVLAWNSARALLEPTSAASDVLGAALGRVGKSTAGQSDADELRPYNVALLAGRHEPVAIFCGTTVFETDDINSLGTAAGADVGEIADLELSGSGGNWGINNGTSATGSTPNFRIIDIEDTRGTYLVIPAPLELSDVYQFFDAAV